MSKNKRIIRNRSTSPTRRDMQPAVRFLGIADLVQQLPGRLRSELLSGRIPPPQIKMDAFTLSRSSAKSMLCGLQSEMGRIMVASRDDGDGETQEIGFAEFMSHCMSIYERAARMHVYPGDFKHVSLMRQIAEKSYDALRQASVPALDVLDRNLFAYIAYYSDLSKELWHYSVIPLNTVSHKNPLRIDVQAVIPEEKRIFFDGKKRPAYRLGWGGEFVDWLDLDGSLVGEKGRIPLYVQKHALHRMSQRLEPISQLSQFNLYNSLIDPVFVTTFERDDSEFIEYIFEYRFKDFKLGYLVVKIVDGMAVVTTFLFITSQRLPESQKMWDTLKMGRKDIEHLGLDCLSGFLETDVFEDAAMTSALEQCGLAHLRDLGDKLHIENRDPQMEYIRKYLSNDRGRTRLEAFEVA